MPEQNNETTIAWDVMDEKHQAMAIAAHAVMLRTRPSQRETVYRIFELGKPMIVFGADDAYCRIHETSVEVMKVLIKNYL